MIEFLQINVDGRNNAQDLMMVILRERGADVLIIGEPHHCDQESEGWFSNIGSKAAIAVINPKIQVQKIRLRNNTGFCWERLDYTTVYACYWSPNTEYTMFVDFLDRLQGSIRSRNGNVIVSGDFNAKSPAWGDHREEKGKALMDMMAGLGMVVCNSGDKPTFSRVNNGGNSMSHIDITFVSGRGNHIVREWKVLSQYTGSFYRYITLRVSATTRETWRPAEKRWLWRKYDRFELVKYITSTPFTTNLGRRRRPPLQNWTSISRTHATAAC